MSLRCQIICLFYWICLRMKNMSVVSLFSPNPPWLSENWSTMHYLLGRKSLWTQLKKTETYPKICSTVEQVFFSISLQFKTWLRRYENFSYIHNLQKWEVSKNTITHAQKTVWTLKSTLHCDCQFESHLRHRTDSL